MFGQIAYLTRPLVSLCMHDRQGRLHHACLRATYFSCPLPIFTNNVLLEEVDTSRKHFFGLDEVGISINFALVHVDCPLCKSMTATRYFQSGFVQFSSSSSCVVCCLPMRFTTHTIFHILRYSFQEKTSSLSVCLNAYILRRCVQCTRTFSKSLHIEG